MHIGHQIRSFLHTFLCVTVDIDLDYLPCTKYINNLIYQTCHQEYNSVFLKLCNLLYLFALSSDDPGHLPLSQEDLADILAVNRVNIAKALTGLKHEGIVVSHHGWLEIRDMSMLARYCSEESLPE